MKDTIEISHLLASRFAGLPQVTAVALGGSFAVGLDDQDSDIDLYVFTRAPLSASARLNVVDEFSLEARNADYWGPATVGRRGVGQPDLDVTFFGVEWLERNLSSVLVQHEARLGYTTAFAHTVHRSQILSDPKSWLAKLQDLTHQHYPETLAANIVALNWPVLRESPHSYRQQLSIAVQRADFVSVNHRVAAFLASYFDVLFAVNRLYHPGEKRLLAQASAHCSILPEDFERHVSSVTAGGPDVVYAVDDLLDALDLSLASPKTNH